MKRDPLDRRRAERISVSSVASLLIHALIALFLFSLPSSMSQQSAPETFANVALVNVSKQAPKRAEPATPQPTAVPAPHASVQPQVKVAAAITRSAQPHPRRLHELAKQAPTAPPNPTPAPVSSTSPNPIPTQPVLSATAAPIEAVVPTSVPQQNVVAALRVPPTAAPTPKPVRTAAPATPKPLPSAVAVAASPRPTAAPSASPAPSAKPQPVKQTPGPAPGIAQTKAAPAPKPVQVPPTPKPETTAAPARAKPNAPARGTSLNARLHNLIPTAGPSFTPAPARHYSMLSPIHTPTPEPEPTPPPSVVAATKFLYVENVAAQRWKQSFLGTAPEEAYVKMYVTSVKRIGFVKWCRGWVVRSPIAGTEHYIVEPDESFLCQGRLEPFTPPAPEPSKGS